MKKHFHDLLPNESSLCLNTKIMKISRVKAKVHFLNCKERMIRFGNPNPLKGMYFQKYFYLKSILSLLEGQTINK